MSGKRARDGSPTGRTRSSSWNATRAQKQGYISSRRFSKIAPWSAFGAMRVQRGTPDNLARFGETYRKATAEQRALRTSTGFTGKGLYSGRGGFWERTSRLRHALAAGIKNYGGPMAAALGHAEMAGRALGMGAYSTPVTNAIVNGGTGTVIPTFREGGDNTVTVSHKEYIGDVFGPEAAGQFQNTVYPINPGLVRTFPWLSQVAANYEEFTLKQCIFTYRTTVTDFVSSGGQVGTIIMATQYNPSDPPFANKQDAMEYDLAMSGKVSEHMLHGVECDPRLNSGTSGKYTRSGPVRQDQDLKSYDHGNLNVCVSNIPQAFANQALGELWVSYTVELRKPKFFVSRGLAIQRDLIVGRTLPGTPLTLADIVDAGQYGLGQQNRIGLEVSLVAKGNETALPPGQVRIRFPQTFSGTVAIKLHVISKGPGQGIVAPFIATYAAPLGTSGIAMFPVADLLSTEPLAPFDTAWQPMVESFTDTTADHSEAQNEWHFNVLTPTSAGTTVDNYFDIGILCTVHAFSLDVAVYNTLFNYPTSNNPVIENPTTSVIEPWP